MGSDRGLKVDGGVSSELASVPKAAGELERRGYDCCWTAEINHDPFLPLVLAAEHTSKIELGTSIAVAVVAPLDHVAERSGIAATALSTASCRDSRPTLPRPL